MNAITREDHVLAESYFYLMTIQTKIFQVTISLDSFHKESNLIFVHHSYEWNPGLCGDPLSGKCGMSEAPPLNSKQDND
ncbi:hypothetical protein ACSBR2_011863 [Camellia fascicularis]